LGGKQVMEREVAGRAASESDEPGVINPGKAQFPVDDRNPGGKKPKETEENLNETRRTTGGEPGK